MPTTCTIQLTGVHAGYDATTAVQELVFNPDLVPVNQRFAFAIFPTTFEHLVRVDVQVVSAAVDTALVVVLFDDNAYTAYSKS